MPATTPEEAFFAALSANSALTTLVSTRIYPTLPTGEPVFPLVIYQRIGEDSTPKLGGKVRLRKYTMRAEAYANSETVSQAIGNAVHDAVLPTTGTFTDPTNGTQGIFDGDSNANITEDGIHVLSRTFSMWWTLPGS